MIVNYLSLWYKQKTAGLSPTVFFTLLTVVAKLLSDSCVNCSSISHC